MYANNNLHFVENLVTEIYIFSRRSFHLCMAAVEQSVSLANSPYFPLSSNIPFVRLTNVHLYSLELITLP